MSNPVKRLHNDIQRLQAAQKTRANDAHALRKDEHALKHDVNQGKREHDAFDKNHKAFKKDHAKLLSDRSAEQKALTPAEAKQTAAQSAYDASVDPTTGLGDPTLKSQLDAANQAVADIHTKFDSKIAAEASTVDKERATGKKDHDAILKTRADIKHERNAIKHDKKALDHAKAHVKTDRKTALKHLKPAEYKMGLKGTNRVRHELGLKSVHHVIRPSKVDLGALPSQYRSYANDIVASAKKYHLSPAYVAAIISRETNGVNELGDFGHGHGLMQIDDRSFGSWIASHHNGLDPKSNIDFGCHLLRENLDTAKRLGLHGSSALKFAASAYNAGIGGAESGLRDGNSDRFTTGGNYGADVLNRMRGFERAFRNA